MGNQGMIKRLLRGLLPAALYCVGQEGVRRYRRQRQAAAPKLDEGACCRLLGDEMGMAPDQLLGLFEHNASDAAVKGIFSKHVGGSRRPFGGHITFGSAISIRSHRYLPPLPSSRLRPRTKPEHPPG